MRRGAEIATDLEEPPRCIVTIRRIAACSGRHQRETTDVDPDVIVLQDIGIAILRRIPEFVALNVDLDVVRRHRQRDVAHTGHIERRTTFGENALARGYGDLAALRCSGRATLEGHGATGDDLDAGLILAVGEHRQIVEGAGGIGGAQQVGRVRRLDQRVTLTVERGFLAVEFRQNSGQAAIGQRDTASSIRGLVRQMDGAAGVHRGGRDQHAALGQRAARQRDVALLCENQTAVGGGAIHAGRADHRREFDATRGRGRVAICAEARAQDEIVTRGKERLPFWRGDRAGVLDLRADHQHETATRRHRSRRAGVDRGATLDHDLTTRSSKARHIAAVDLRAENAIGAELRIVDIRARRHQRPDIHLAIAAEDDAVAVDDQHLAVGLDIAEDLTRPDAGSDAVEHGPVAIALLIEGQRGARADIETLPVQDRLLRGLADIDLGLPGAIDALRRSVGAAPAGRHVW